MSLNTIKKCKRTQTQKTTYGLILFRQVSTKDKLIETESRIVAIWVQR